jgi:hypothetical protein
MSRLAALSFRAKTLGINGNEALDSVSRRVKAFLLFGELRSKSRFENRP